MTAAAMDPQTGSDVDEVLGRLIRDVPDFPLPGIVFKDITPLLGDAAGFATVLDALSAVIPDDVTSVAGIEARGFILAAPLAVQRGIGFVPVRKAGKLPGKTRAVAFALSTARPSSRCTTTRSGPVSG
jgi:adenine phosphoribosyltransferase